MSVSLRVAPLRSFREKTTRPNRKMVPRIGWSSSAEFGALPKRSSARTRLPNQTRMALVGGIQQRNRVTAGVGVGVGGLAHVREGGGGALKTWGQL